MSELTKREEQIITLKAAPIRSARFLEALRDAKTRVLGEAIKEVVYKPAGVSVNRRRHGVLIDHLVTRATAMPVLELGAAGKTKEVAS